MPSQVDGAPVLHNGGAANGGQGLGRVNEAVQDQQEKGDDDECDQIRGMGANLVLSPSSCWMADGLRGWPSSTMMAINYST